MKRKALIALALLVVGTLLVGCGGVSQDEFDQAVADKDAALAQVTTLQSQLTKAQSDLTAATAAKTKAEADLATAQAALTKANSDLTASKAQVTSLTSQVSTLTAEKTALQKQVTDLTAEVAALKAGGGGGGGTTPPPAGGFTGTKYSDTTYGFSFQYPTDWTAAATLPKDVITMFGAAPYSLPRIVVIVEDKAANATLEDAFKAYVTANAYTFKSFTVTDVTIGGVACKKGSGVYASAYGDANGKLVGFEKSGKWVIILATTVDALGAWPNATMQDGIINSITFP